MAKYEAQIELSRGIEVSFQPPLFTGDVGNTVKLTFFLRGEPYAAQAAELYGTLRDGTAGSVAAVMKGNEAEFTLPNTFYPQPGETKLQVALLNGEGDVLTSGLLYFETLEGLGNQAEPAGSDQYNDMTALLSTVGNELGRMEQVLSQISAAVVIIGTGEDLAALNGKTVNGATVFVTATVQPEENYDVTFQNCTVYGNGYSMGSFGVFKYQQCNIRNLNINIPEPSNEESGVMSGASVVDHSTLTDCTITQYFDPDVRDSELIRCSFYTVGMRVYTKNCNFTDCDFNGCSPSASSGSTYNHFLNCKNIHGTEALTGSCSFFGCSGSVKVASGAACIPATAEDFAKVNSATLTIA